MPCNANADCDDMWLAKLTCSNVPCIYLWHKCHSLIEDSKWNITLVFFPAHLSCSSLLITTLSAHYTCVGVTFGRHLLPSWLGHSCWLQSLSPSQSRSSLSATMLDGDAGIVTFFDFSRIFWGFFALAAARALHSQWTLPTWFPYAIIHTFHMN